MTAKPECPLVARSVILRRRMSGVINRAHHVNEFLGHGLTSKLATSWRDANRSTNFAKADHV